MILKEYVNMLNEMAQSLNEGYGRVNIFVYQGVGKKKRLSITGADLPKFFNRKGLTLFRDREKFTKTTIGLGKNINKWNVSHVEEMAGMFYDSEFNGDISKWDVSNVRNMNEMFYKSEFNGDISKWDVSSVNTMGDMFKHSPLEGNEPDWYKDLK